MLVNPDLTQFKLKNVVVEVVVSFIKIILFQSCLLIIYPVRWLTFKGWDKYHAIDSFITTSRCRDSNVSWLSGTCDALFFARDLKLRQGPRVWNRATGPGAVYQILCSFYLGLGLSFASHAFYPVTDNNNTVTVKVRCTPGMTVPWNINYV